MNKHQITESSKVSIPAVISKIYAWGTVTLAYPRCKMVCLIIFFKLSALASKLPKKWGNDFQVDSSMFYKFEFNGKLEILCYGLKVPTPAEILTPTVRVWGGGASGSQWGHKDRAVMMGWSRQWWLPHLLSKRGTREEAGVRKPGSRRHRHRVCQRLDLGLASLQSVRS